MSDGTGIGGGDDGNAVPSSRGGEAAFRSLADCERELRGLEENLPDYIVRYDRECRLVYANPRVMAVKRRLLGRNPIGERPSDSYPDGSFAAFEAALCRVVTSGRTEDFEFQLPEEGYGGQYHLIRMAAYRDAAGEVVGVITIGRDITERKRTEMRLQKSLREFNELVDRVPVGVFKLLSGADGGWAFEYVSPRWCELIGVSEALALGDFDAVMDCVHPDERADLQARMGEAVAALRPFTWEGRIVHEAGERWVHIESNPAPEASGDIRWNGVVQDIGERRRAEEHRRLTASVFADSHEGIVITDAEARIVEVNEAFSRITGYERDEVLGRNPRLLKSSRQDAPFYAAMWHAITQNGHWSGEVWNRRKDGVIYPEYLTISAVHNHSGKVTHYAGVFADITALKEQERQLERIAHFDALTGMPNRTLLGDRLNQAIAHARRNRSLVAVASLDLDDFAPINERFGRPLGDRLLVRVAERLKEELRGDDTVARLGGDEFVLLLPDLADVEQCAAILQRLLDAVAGEHAIDGRSISLSASVGVTLFPLDSADPEILLRHADQAMYRAKQEGKNRFHLFNPEQDRKLRDRRESLERLAEALREEAFVLYYQPKVELASGAVIGAEALIRWQHPERGLLPPTVFLPLLEGSELAVAVGEWVIDSALARIAAWKAEGLALTVSVNVDADHIMRPDFVEQLRAILARHPAVAPGDLELEILESTAISDIERAGRVLESVAAMGIGLALDDFGTGYSSLSHFSKLPVDVLKIDQNFVRNMLADPENLNIIEGITFLANAFRRPVVAEGVETLEHFALLLHLGCPYGQGYGIARPMPAEAFVAWREAWQREAPWRALPAIDLPKEDVVLQVAGASHRQWVDEVVAALEGPEALPPPLNRRQCRFGRWYHGNGHSRYGHLPGYAVLGQAHERVHGLAAELLALAAAGDRDGARGRCDELYALRGRFLVALEQLAASVRAGG
ncbi:EAL domain-containing protein [Endothiovibrio diazotrophicus]